MSKTYTRKQFLENQEFLLQEANNNKIFVYPTDTIYGIGAISTPENKARINQIKKRPEDKILSVITPNIEWIIENYPIPNAETIISKKNLNLHLDNNDGVTFIFDPLFW